MKRLIAIIMLAVGVMAAQAQLYTGMHGLIQTPSAEMGRSGDARMGMYYMNHAMLPGRPFNSPDSDPYNTCGFYVSLTPFSWIEIGYSIALMKGSKGGSLDDSSDGYNHKDQAFSLRLRPLKEGKWWPSVVVGATDLATTVPGNKGNNYFGNYYLAATKHLTAARQTFGLTLAFRHYSRDFNRKWNGLTAGFTYRPSFYKDARVIVEWTGREVNFGADCTLFRHLIIQAALVRGKHFSGGLCYTVNLF